MSFYSNLSKTAATLLKQKGQLVTLRRITEGAYDAATGAATQTVTLYSGHGAVFAFPQREVDGDAVQRDDRKVLLSASTTMPAPEVGDELLIGSVPYRVINASTVAPAGEAVMHTLQVRAGG